MTDDPAELHRRFGTLLVPLARAYRRQLDRSLAGLALSHSMALAVMLIGRGGDGMRQGALAEQLGMEAPSVVPIVDQMERAGLVERRVDAGDKRARTLHLTTAGRALAEQAEARTAEVRRALLAGIDDDDLSTAIRVLERLGDAIEIAGRD